MTTQLTPSQESAYEKLDFFFNLGLNSINAVDGIIPRPIPLIVGPSGCGKTFLVGQLATKYALPFYSINISNWIVRGARNESQVTMEQLREYISGNDQGVIFLDEVNKLRNSHIGESSWTADVFTECIAFLDRDDRLEAMGLLGLVEKLRRNFIIVGAAAFQDEWRATQQKDSSIGFLTGELTSKDQERSYEEAIRKQNTIPEELLFRFNDRLIVILPPTPAEYGKRIASLRITLQMQELSEKELADLATEAVNSGKSMRWLEGYLTECLSQLSGETLKSLAQAPFEGTSTGSRSSKPKGSSSFDRRRFNEIRQACFVNYEQSLKGLSQTSRQLYMLLDGINVGRESGVHSTDRESLCQCLTTMGEMILPQDDPENHCHIVRRGLNYLADKGVNGTSTLKSDAERGKIATDVARIACTLAGVLPVLLAHCGESSEQRAIRERVLVFVVHAESLCAHLDDLRSIDSSYGARQGN